MPNKRKAASKTDDSVKTSHVANGKQTEESVPLRKSARLTQINQKTNIESKVATKKPVAKTKKTGKSDSQMDSGSDESWKNAKSIYEFSANDIKGESVSLEKYKGHVLLIVNVASKCGLTANNYKELVELDEKYRESKGLRILAFPCNQFSNQEPGSSEDIVCFAKKKNATFDMFEKIEVNGKNAHPLWKYLKHKQGGTLGDNIKWNFTKFIVDKEGQPVERFSPTTAPSKIADHLEKYF